MYGLSTDGCTTCTDSVEPIVRSTSDGGHYETFGWRVEVTSKRRPDFDSTRNVAAAVEYAAGRTFPTRTPIPSIYGQRSTSCSSG